MTTTIALRDAQNSLAEIIHRLAPCEVVTITENDQPVAQLVPFPAIRQRPPRLRPPVTGTPKAGTLKGKIWMADDFDEPLEELREYME